MNNVLSSARLPIRGPKGGANRLEGDGILPVDHVGKGNNAKVKGEEARLLSSCGVAKGGAPIDESTAPVGVVLDEGGERGLGDGTVL